MLNDNIIQLKETSRVFVNPKFKKTIKLMQDTVAFVARKDAGSPSPHYKGPWLIKLLLKSNPTNYRTPVVSSFQVLMPPTFINWLMNLRKLGEISSPFCIL